MGDHTKTEGSKQAKESLWQIQTEIWEQLGGRLQNFKSLMGAGNIVLQSIQRWQLRLMELSEVKER